MKIFYVSRQAGWLGLLTAALLLASRGAWAQSDNLGNHSATQNLMLNDYDLRLRSAGDGNHGLGWYGASTSTKNWLGQTVDGPVLYGYSGGVLGINQNGTRSSVLTWNSTGNVGIGVNPVQYKLHVGGTGYFTGALGTAGALSAGGNATITGNVSVGGQVLAAGRIGSGTTTPLQPLHLASGDTPAVRLEQNGTSAYPLQTWEIAGNEVNFFVRDVTNSGRLPFRIRPGAPTSSLDISAAGNVGIGTTLPRARLHVNGGVKINGANPLEFGADVSGKDPDAGTIGYGNLTADALNIVGAGTSTTDRKVVVYSEGGMVIKGNLTLTGPVVSTSDARLKQDVRPLAGALPAVLALQGHRYRFRPGTGPTGEQVGLLAQELEKVYPELVSTGPDGLKAVNYAQLTPVLIEALKEQQRQLDALRTELSQTREQLRQQAAPAANAAIEQRLQALEQALANGRATPAPTSPTRRPTTAATAETADGRPH